MRKLLALVMAITSLLSCNKEDDKEIKTDYLPLRIGNYWIYQEYNIDTMGNEIARSKLDSVIIKRDTIINDKKYYVFEGTYYPFTNNKWGIIDILRDSSGYIVNQNGIIQFAENDFTNPIAYFAHINHYDSNDTLFVMSHQMERIDNVIAVPAGTYDEVLNYKGTVVTSMNTPGILYPRYLNCYYAKGVGKIIYTYFYIASPNIYEKRLLRYYVK
jgi:hypothetical protein